ncbi:hypothetical protein [Achromobacter aloeverae]|uniref:hypothetical protein n=1 Tax=Achromobacter aloeverae TaxID=1750518 RepID=UPI00100E3AD7|nr:hypothetical protein [Achromobacter aloeverae]
MANSDSGPLYLDDANPHVDLARNLIGQQEIVVTQMQEGGVRSKRPGICRSACARRLWSWSGVAVQRRKMLWQQARNRVSEAVNPGQGTAHAAN